MLTNERIFELTVAAVKTMFEQKGADFTFPFDAIWQYIPNGDLIPSTKRPGQARKLLSTGYIKETGEMTLAATPSRAGSRTPAYCFGPALPGDSLQFLIIKNNKSTKKSLQKRYPTATLRQTDWNDFGYQTTFQAMIEISQNETIDLGEVKILHGRKVSDQENLPASFFSNHRNNDFCSLGQNLNYYENLLKLAENLYKQYLNGMNDIVFNPEKQKRHENKPGYKLSLVRFASAMQTLSDAPALFGLSNAIKQYNTYDGPNFDFRTSLAGNADSIDINFNFKSADGLPNRLNIVIGYNGTGKTQLLANLAISASGYGYETKKDLLMNEYGQFISAPPNFGGILVVSYSAFDTFKIPGIDQAEKKQVIRDGSIFGYTYCGLRKLLSEEGNEPIYALKNQEEINDDYINAISRIKSSTTKTESFLKVLRALTTEASFQRINFMQFDNRLPSKESFSSLSTGHKIVLSITAQLAAFLDKEKRMLVLIDEPEAHLHPPLLAALLHSIRICMEEFDAHAIIATHSPIVLQETPSRFIRILRRIDNASDVTSPNSETFGENIGVITQDIFNLDDGVTDWHKTLQKLAENNTLEDIETKFGKRLGFSARSYVMSLIDED